MKNLVWIALLLFFMDLTAQVNAESEVKQTIEMFFKGFHAKDTVLMKQYVGGDVIVQTVGRTKDGTASLRTEDFGKFLTSIASIPDSVDFQERLLSYSIQIDGAMANAWTPYEFWHKGEFSHCGVNSFQLFKDQGKWKIIYLIDTRRREGCGH